MAVLGTFVPCLKPWITHGSRRIGSCTTRHKKTMRRKMRRQKGVAEFLAEVNAEMEVEAKDHRSAELLSMLGGVGGALALAAHAVKFPDCHMCYRESQPWWNAWQERDDPTWAEQQREKLMMRQFVAAASKTSFEVWKREMHNKGFHLIRDFVGLKPRYSTLSQTQKPPPEGKLLDFSGEGLDGQ